MGRKWRSSSIIYMWDCTFRLIIYQFILLLVNTNLDLITLYTSILHSPWAAINVLHSDEQLLRQQQQQRSTALCQDYLGEPVPEEIFSHPPSCDHHPIFISCRDMGRKWCSSSRIYMWDCTFRLIIYHTGLWFWQSSWRHSYCSGFSWQTTNWQEQLVIFPVRFSVSKFPSVMIMWQKRQKTCAPKVLSRNE